MRRSKYIFIVLSSIFFMGCSDEGMVEIDSLSYPGNSFFQGQYVPIWVSVKVSNLKNATYYWECSGGEFLYNPGTVETLSHTIWKAPKVNGDYTITCTVKCDGAEQSRVTKIKVANFFLVRFEVTNDNQYFVAVNYPLTSGVLTNVKNGEAELIGSKNNTQGQFSMLNPVDSALHKSTFTFNIDMAWRTKFKSANTPIAWSYTFYKPKSMDGTIVMEYIREVQILLFPNSISSTIGLPTSFGTVLPTGSNFIIGYEVFNPVYSTSKWYTITAGRNEKFLMTDGALATAVNKGYRNFGLRIDANNIVGFGMDKAYQINSTKLQDWFTAHPTINPTLYLKNIIFRSYDECNMYLDNWGVELE